MNIFSSRNMKTFRSVILTQKYHPILDEATVGDLILFEPVEKLMHITNSINFRLITGLYESFTYTQLQKDLSEKEITYPKCMWLTTFSLGVSHKNTPKRFILEMQPSFKNKSIYWAEQINATVIEHIPEINDLWKAGYKASPKLVQTILGKDRIEELWLMLDMLTGRK